VVPVRQHESQCLDGRPSYTESLEQHSLGTLTCLVDIREDKRSTCVFRLPTPVR
jgi:hypothetical protein